MKRVADKQLIKDGRDEEADEEVGTGFRKADESTLARRQIRGLPKRSLAGAAGAVQAPSPAGFSWGAPAPSLPSPMATEDATPVSKFGGFSGFGGSSAATTSPFTFGSSATNTSSTTATSTTSATPSFGSASGSPAPTTTAGASNATKTFASFLSGHSSTNGTDSKPSPAPAVHKPLPAVTAPSPASNSEDDKRALTYYTSLRGLNVSLANAITRYIDQDPFADLSILLEQYKGKRVDIEKEFDSKKPGAIHTNGVSAAPAKFIPPPASGSTFAPPPISASSSTDSKSPSLGSGFSFTPKPAPLSAKSSFTLPPSIESKPSDSKPASSGFSFGGSSGAGTTTPPTSQGFSFGAQAKGTNTHSGPSSGGFSFSAPAKDSNLPSAPSSSGFNFAAPAKDSGPSSTPSSLGFSFSAPAKDSSASSLPTSSGFSFGAPAKDTSSSSSGFSFGAPPKPSASAPSSLPFSLTPRSSVSAPKPFSFGGDKAKDEDEGQEDAKPAPSTPSGPFGLSSNSFSASPFGTFGKPAGSSGFSFGSSSAFGGGSTPSAFGGAAAGSSFSFSGATANTVAKKEDGAEEETQEASTSTGNDSAADGVPTAASMLGVNPHDEEGEGEEDEETIHAIKSKAFRMKKADEKGGPGWVEIGYGVLRLKKHKETSARRMLLRNSTTGKININFALYSGLKPSLTKKAVTFIGHDNGVAQTYSVRVPNEEAAKELKEVLEREIAFVKAKESD